MGIPGDFGSTLVGGLISAVRLEVIWHNNSTGTYVYYMHDSGDASTIKFIVAGIWILDTLHASFMGHFLYHYLITNYGVPASLEYIVWSYPASLLVNLLVITVVQFFFAHKIFHLCRRKLRWLVTVPIILLVLAHFGFAMATAIVILVKNVVSYALHVRLYTATPGACAIALAEVLITVSLCLLLYESGSHSAVPRTKRLLNTLIVYAVNRCWLTLLVVIGEVTMDANDQISIAEYPPTSPIPGFRSRVRPKHECYPLREPIEAFRRHGEFKGRSKAVRRVRSGCHRRHHRTGIC
ncbi:hypothetical protein EV401DRAFT_796255 [Pisolithus croceorrhizus]|nr:hypothetical protein EV401DRAFT_796255 [Pisolithus croceorrhizus]